MIKTTNHILLSLVFLSVFLFVPAHAEDNVLWKYEQSLKKCPKKIICQEHTWRNKFIFCSSYPEDSPGTKVCDMCYGHFATLKNLDLNNKEIEITPDNKNLGKCNYEFKKINDSYGCGITDYGQYACAYIWWEGKLSK